MTEILMVYQILRKIDFFHFFEDNSKSIGDIETNLSEEKSLTKKFRYHNIELCNIFLENNSKMEKKFES